MKWYIGNVEIKGQIVLAPMAGISNPPFMKICEKMGASYMVTELISAEGIVRGNQKTLEMFKGYENIKVPIGLQLFGSDPKTMASAAKIVEETHLFSVIDINMGCPVPKVAIKNEAGSALLKNPEKIFAIVKAVVDAVTLPVTVKIRAGWDEKSINCSEVAKICEKAGAKAIAIHARTRSQSYSGKANWSLISETVKNINIPMIGNGDVTSCFDAKKMLDETGCTAVMIGRGLLGNPWLIKECNDFLDKNILPKKVTYKEKIQMMKSHLRSVVKSKGEKAGVLEIRSHFLYYLKGMPQNAEIKNQICKTTSEKEINIILDNYLNSLK